MKTVRLLVFCFAATLAGLSGTTAEKTNVFPTVEAQICEGRIEVDSDPVNVSAAWRIEWPEAVAGVGTQALARIRRQMIDDCFGSLMDGPNRRASQLYPLPNQALQLVFSRVYGKLDVMSDDESLLLHAFDFAANLTIRFADAGYIGYVLDGYNNEGGSGNFSYVTARVFSLATGQPVTEADFMTAAGRAAFPKTFFNTLASHTGL